MNLLTFDDFEPCVIEAESTKVFVRRCGQGVPVLLLLGFPETHLMWRSVAPLMANHFTLVCADLPGYGQSGIPHSQPDHAQSSKRTMAHDMVMVMEKLGFPTFSVAGHDRGGRVAYRLALDHPERIKRLAVLDILPVGEVWQRAKKRLVLGYWPWSLLAQPEPLPESLLSSAPEAVITDALGGWGSPMEAFSSQIREAYMNVLRDPLRVHAICEEYRAATIDHEHDQEDRRVGRKIRCPVLVLWSSGGPVDVWYEDAGGPLAIWSQWGDHIKGKAMKGGHFFPEAFPEETAREPTDFVAL